MKKISNKVLIVFFVILLAVASCIYYFFNNEDFLFSLMLSSNSERIDRFAIKRVLEISKKKDIVDIIINNLENEVNVDKTSTYMITLGIIGDSRASQTLSSLYIGCQNKADDPHCITIQNFSVVGLGLLGNSDYKKFVTKILDNYDYHHTRVDKQTLAESIYLMTGDQYIYKDGGVTRKLIPWDSLIAARKAIMDSKGRKRSIEEMMILFDAIM